MAYIFNYIADIAQKHLAPRYHRGPEPFTTHAKMILYLAEIFKNPFEAQDAHIEFCKLSIKESESFSDFYTQFLHLSSIGKIPIDDLQPDLYNKLTPALQQSVLPFLDTLLTNKALANKCMLVDKNLRRLRQRQSQLRTAQPTPKAPTTFPTQRTSVTSPLGQRNTRATSPKPSTKIYRPLCEPTPARPDPEDACYRYKQPGHFAKDYPKPPKPRTEVQELAEPPSGTNSELENEED